MSCPQIPVKVTLLGNRVFADVSIKMRPSGWAQIHYDWCPHKKRKMPQGECDDGDRDWSEAAASQGMPRIDSPPPETGRGGEGFYPESQRESGPADALL